MEESLKKDIIAYLEDALSLFEMGLSPFKDERMGPEIITIIIHRLKNFPDQAHIVQQAIRVLMVSRASVDYTPLLGPDYEKLPDTANLERVINQAKQAVAVMEANQQNT